MYTHIACWRRQKAIVFHQLYTVILFVSGDTCKTIHSSLHTTKRWSKRSVECAAEHLVCLKDQNTVESELFSYHTSI